MKTCNLILGVDVSKLTLDISCAKRRLHIKIDNDNKGFSKFKKWCKTNEIPLSETMWIAYPIHQIFRPRSLLFACRKPNKAYLSVSSKPYGFFPDEKAVNAITFFLSCRLHLDIQHFPAQILINFYYFKKNISSKDSALPSIPITEISSVLWPRLTSALKSCYTALCHTMIAPSLFNDVNVDYRGADKKVYKNAGLNNYTTLSLWDTYRGLNPLMTILQPERVNDIVKTILAIYQQRGKLPVWHLHGNETDCMIGYPAVPVIVDAYLKGFRNYDVELAYRALRQSAMQDTNGIQYIQKLKTIPADLVEESVAKAMEYAISDGSIAQMAKALGKMDDFKYFTERSKLYQQYFDNGTGHFRGRMADGSWRTPFNPYNAAHRQNDYCEGNAWQYTWLVPQDVNEPNHHIPYLYTLAGQPWRTAEIVRQIDEQFYTDKSDGLCGNDDVGEMSAWYVFSALGFYPVNPTSSEYVFGSPLINDALIKLSGNKTFKITVVGNNKDNPYIHKIELNHKPYTKSFITHQAIVAGGEMKIYMGNKPIALKTNTK